MIASSLLSFQRHRVRLSPLKFSLPLIGFWFGCFSIFGRGVYRWSCGNITLLGDACHPATPNNGQGACMAIEDALVLATLLAEHWDKPDGHVEAFYLYEVSQVYSVVRSFFTMSTLPALSPNVLKTTP